MKRLMIIIMNATFLFISGCASDKNTGAPTPAYVTYYFPVYYPAYSYAPYFDEHYEPGPYNNNFNYYGYYGYWGQK